MKLFQKIRIQSVALLAAIWLFASCVCGVNNSPSTESSTPPKRVNTWIDVQPKNPFIESVRKHREDWKKRRLTDYVLVYQGYLSGFRHLRVVVAQGRPIETTDIVDGGIIPIAYVATIDSLYDYIEGMAQFGEGNIPVRFNVEYDQTYGYPLSAESDGRAAIADDEDFIQVNCFDVDTNGCRPILLKDSQCLGAGGTMKKINDGGCDEGWSIGLTESSQVCCRKYSGKEADEITENQCKAIGGVADEKLFTSQYLSVGGSQIRQAGCMRRFVE